MPLSTEQPIKNAQQTTLLGVTSPSDLKWDTHVKTASVHNPTVKSSGVQLSSVVAVVRRPYKIHSDLCLAFLLKRVIKADLHDRKSGKKSSKDN